MTYNQSKIRTRFNDATMSSILHLHDTALSDPQKSLTPAPTLLKVVILCSLHDKMTMSKHIGEQVCIIFDGVRFHGEVTKVIFRDVHAQYIYHVVDSEAYWCHELEMIRSTILYTRSHRFG